MSKFFFTFVTVLFVFSFFVPASLSHGLGQTLRKETGNYATELEYEALEITEDDPVEYAFRLLDKDTNKPVEFDVASVRVAEMAEDRGVFSVNINPVGVYQSGPRVYLKLQEGEYSFKVTFTKDGEDLVKESFDINVLKGESKEDIVLTLSGFLGGITLTVILFFIYRRYGKKLKQK